MDILLGWLRSIRAPVPVGFVLAICAGLALALAAQTWYLRSQVFNTSAFTARATHVAADEHARAAVAVEISDVLAAKARISAATIRPTIEQALSSRSFKSLLLKGARDFNAALFHGALRHDSLRIPLGALRGSKVVPARVLDSTSVEIVTTRAKSVLRHTNNAADVVRVLSIALPIFALLALAVAVPLVRRVSRVFAAAALAVAVAGVVMLPLLSHLRGRMVHALRFTRGLDPGHANAFAAAIWRGFFGAMHTIALVALVAGALVGIGLLLWGVRPRRGSGLGQRLPETRGPLSRSTGRS